MTSQSLSLNCVSKDAEVAASAPTIAIRWALGMNEDAPPYSAGTAVENFWREVLAAGTPVGDRVCFSASECAASDAGRTVAFRGIAFCGVASVAVENEGTEHVLISVDALALVAGDAAVDDEDNCALAATAIEVDTTLHVGGGKAADDADDDKVDDADVEGTFVATAAIRVLLPICGVFCATMRPILVFRTLTCFS